MDARREGKRLINIAEVAKVFLASIETVRKYKRIGIIRPVGVRGRADLYEYEEIRNIREVVEQQRAKGKSLEDISGYVKLYINSSRHAVCNHNKAILIVDDDITTSDLLRELLYDRFTRDKIDVHSAENGDDAVAMASMKHFNIIILDIGLPGESGFKLHDRLKNVPTSKNSIYIYMSGLVRFEQDTPQFIQKPFEPNAFICVIRDILGKLDNVS